MGLDMYAYVAKEARDQDSIESVSEDLAYWRKHPNLHGWMERLAKSKGLDYDTFNGVELELTFDDVMQLEKDIKNNSLPGTTGFFFGENSDEYYKGQDLDFVYEAKSRLFLGQRVFYNSSW